MNGSAQKEAHLQEQISQRNLSWHTENCAWMSVSDIMSTLSLHLGQLRQGGVFSRHWHLRRCSLQGCSTRACWYDDGAGSRYDA